MWRSGSRIARAQKARIEQLYQQIGQLNVEVDRLRKKGNMGSSR